MDLEPPSLADAAGEYARLAVRNIATEVPYADAHVMSGPDDLARPRRRHPAFGGSFDWHSSAHMHWLAVRLLRTQPAAVPADEIAEALDGTLRADALRTEADYLRAHPSFERPYGWAWAALLAAECAGAEDEGGAAAGRGWAAAARPLAEEVAELAQPWLAGLGQPVRHGTHANTAFGVLLLRRAFGRLGLLGAARDCELAAWRLFGGDRDYPFGWEPSGHDFLSPGLCEAELMSEVLAGGRREDWLHGLCNQLITADGEVALAPEAPEDDADGQAVHLHGLNLSRSWQLARLADVAGPGAAGRALRDAAERHLRAGLPHVLGGGYAATHWLATFAVLALEARQPSQG
jgi:hypothetical protein